jgi:integrase
MNVENLRERYPELIAWMKSVGYHKNYTYHVEREIKRIINRADIEGWKSYSDVYHEYASRLKSLHTLQNKRTFLGLIEHFDVYGQYPNGRRRQKILKRAKYHKLNDEFRAVIDYYCAAEKRRGKKDATIYGESSNASSFLYSLQEKGFDSLQSITEVAILSVFVDDEGRLCRSSSHKKNVVAVLKACVPQDPETFTRMLAYFPILREKRKNIQYLLPEEITVLKQVLSDDNAALTLRDKAIGKLALYTGLRSCDIAGLTMNSIDWEKDLIFISQQKTDAPLELPLTAIVGNAVYDYLILERPRTESDHVFVSENRPYIRLENGSLGNISNKIMDAAGIRLTNGDRRGVHIFRHRLATALLGNGVARPVISRILGHTDPDSLDPYLSADFVHLKECALSIERFPMDEGVFANA